MILFSGVQPVPSRRNSNMTVWSGASTPPNWRYRPIAGTFDRSVRTHAWLQPTARPASNSARKKLRRQPSAPMRGGHADLVHPQLGRLVRVDVVDSRRETDNRPSVPRHRHVVSRVGQELGSQRRLHGMVEHVRRHVREHRLVSRLEKSNLDRHARRVNVKGSSLATGPRICRARRRSEEPDLGACRRGSALPSRSGSTASSRTRSEARSSAASPP